MGTIHQSVGRAITLFGSEKFDEAEQVLRAHLARHADDAEGNYLMAVVLLRGPGMVRAAYFAERAVKANPNDPRFASTLGLSLLSAKRPADAVRVLVEARARLGDRPDLLGPLGRALVDVGQAEEGLGVLRLAFERSNFSVDAALNLIAVCSRLGDVSAVRGVLALAVEHNPNHADLRMQLAMAMNYPGDVAPGEMLAAHEAAARCIERGVRPAPTPTIAQSRDGVIRVGLLSPDLRSHSVAWFVEPLLRELGRTGSAHGLTATCYASVRRPDDTTRRLQSLGCAWRDVHSLADAACADQVRRDGIDVLIDLAGFTQGSRVGVLAHRAAPIQATYLGYPNTTCLARCDFRLVDSITDPPDAPSHGTERLIRLDPCFLCYQPPQTPEIQSATPSARGLPVTFGSFNAVFKLSSETIELWSKVLSRVEGSRLLLKNAAFSFDAARKRVANAFAHAGISPDRLDLVDFIKDKRGHLAAYDRVDIALDPFPYHGTTTTCESLLMGIPVVTLAGNRHAARVGVSLLHTVGADDLVAHSLDAFVDLAASLAQDKERLNAYRHELPAKVRGGILCDAPAFATRFAAAVRQMVELGPRPG